MTPCDFFLGFLEKFIRRPWSSQIYHRNLAAEKKTPMMLQTLQELFTIEPYCVSSEKGTTSPSSMCFTPFLNISLSNISPLMFIVCFRHQLHWRPILNNILPSCFWPTWIPLGSPRSRFGHFSGFFYQVLLLWNVQLMSTCALSLIFLGLSP